jgi:hypothetical protein
LYHRVKEDSNIINTKKKKRKEGRKANWIGHILHRTCLLKHFTEGKIKTRLDVTVRRSDWTNGRKWEDTGNLKRKH